MLRPPSFADQGKGKGSTAVRRDTWNDCGGGDDEDHSNLYLDDRSYYKIVRFAYSELAIVLRDSDNRWMIWFPVWRQQQQKTKT